MAAITHICTHCGYEGKPVKPPSDEATDTNPDASKALARIVNLVLPGAGLMIRPLALFISLPIHILLWPIKRKLKGGPRHCSNCGLPLMVPLSSDAGWLAKRRLDIKMGLVVIGKNEEAPKLAFGREVVLPGDEKPAEMIVEERLTSLPSLEKLLAPKPEKPAPAPKEKKEIQAKPEKKPVDPDQW
jgi:hypothetical protein